MVRDVWARQLEVNDVQSRQIDRFIPRKDTVPAEASGLEVKVGQVSDGLKIKFSHPRRGDFHVLEPSVMHLNVIDLPVCDVHI